MSFSFDGAARIRTTHACSNLPPGLPQLQAAGATTSAPSPLLCERAAATAVRMVHNRVHEASLTGGMRQQTAPQHAAPLTVSYAQHACMLIEPMCMHMQQCHRVRPVDLGHVGTCAWRGTQDALTANGSAHAWHVTFLRPLHAACVCLPHAMHLLSVLCLLYQSGCVSGICRDSGSSSDGLQRLQQEQVRAGRLTASERAAN